MVEWAASRSGKVGSPKVQNGWALVSHLAGKPKLMLMIAGFTISLVVFGKLYSYRYSDYDMML